MNFECPHCHNKEATANRVQGPDELQWQVPIDTVRELWQCDCGGYFIIEYKINNITKLIEDGNNN